LPAFTPSDWIAAGSGVIAVCALAVAVNTVRRSNRTSSVATLVTLNDGFRELWKSYFAAAPEQKDHEFFELLNLLEIACGIHCEKSLVGIARELSQEYVEHVLLLIERTPEACARLEHAVHAPTTFRYIARFRARMRRRDPQLGLLPEAA
jgi:hypothetical protein